MTPNQKNYADNLVEAYREPMEILKEGSKREDRAEYLATFTHQFNQLNVPMSTASKIVAIEVLTALLSFDVPDDQLRDEIATMWGVFIESLTESTNKE